MALRHAHGEDSNKALRTSLLLPKVSVSSEPPPWFLLWSLNVLREGTTMIDIAAERSLPQHAMEIHSIVAKGNSSGSLNVLESILL